MARAMHTTGVETFFADDEIIVSKTDPNGRLTYVNDVFLKVSGFTEDELIGQQHSIIRHPEMPRTVFKLLWDTIGEKSEIFAYVKNRCKNGDHYWVLAHVTPTYDNRRAVIGYHSSRRVPRREAIAAVEPIYRALSAEENRHADRKKALVAATQTLNDLLTEKGMRYDEFVLSL